MNTLSSFDLYATLLAEFLMAALIFAAKPIPEL